MKKIIIIGGGIAGLTLAYHLSKHNNLYEIHIYEKHNELGGYARTVKHYEHSPRVILPGYDYFTEICYNIDDIRINLKIAKSKDIGYSLSIFSVIRVILSLVPYIFTCPNEDNLTLKDIISNIDKETYRYIVSLCAKIGEHPDVMPVSKIIHLCYTLIRPFDNYYTFTKNTGEAFFNPLETELLKRGVNIYKNHILTNINYNGNKIDNIKINNEIVNGDIFILALDITSLAKVYNNDSIKILKDKTIDLQLGLQINFNRIIYIDNDADFLSFNTDWYIILQRREISWKSCNNSSWSICLPYINRYISKRTGKLVLNSDSKEICEEIVYQLSKYIDIQMEDITDYKVWESWRWNGKEWNTYEPYFSQHSGSYKYRPFNITPYKNLYLAGAITRTKYHQWYMEGAAESGVNVYRLIHPKNKYNNIKFIILYIILYIIILYII